MLLPIKNRFFDCCGPVGLVNRNPTDFQSQVFCRPPQATSAKAGDRECKDPSREILATCSGL